MTPDRRLDQIEPLVAEVLQKVDRLTEATGQILELAVNNQSNLSNFKEEVQTEFRLVKTTNEITARAVADLTVSTQKQFNELKTGLGGIKTDLEDLTASTQQQFDELKTGFGDLKDDFAKLKAGQELILQILREKLS